MSVREQVLQALEQSRGNPVSGEKLAQSLGISRTAVWKAITSLRQEGYRIQAASRRGYSLDFDNDILSAWAIRMFLPEELSSLPIEVLDEVDSTNAYARVKAAKGAPHGMIIVANAQSAGRGRMGHSFYSPQGTGLYFSAILHPNSPYESSLLLTSAAAVSVCQTLEELYDLEPRIKWVNDIYLKERKVCGILCEAQGDFESGMVESVVVGIGVNCTTMVFPAEIAASAGALNQDKMNRNQLAARIITHLMEWQKNLSDPTLIEEYRRRNFLLGQPIRYRQGNVWRMGKAMDINEKGNLIILDENEEEKVLSTGEVSQVRLLPRKD